MLPRRSHDARMGCGSISIISGKKCRKTVLSNAPVEKLTRYKSILLVACLLIERSKMPAREIKLTRSIEPKIYAYKFIFRVRIHVRCAYVTLFEENFV